jgi:outer membrane immunogenic protein
MKKMKNLFFVPAFVLLSLLSFAQSPLPLKHTQINTGLGFSDWGVPVYVGFDYSVHKDITLGAELSFRGYNEYWHDYYYHHNVIGFSGNANYHFNTIFKIPRNWDLYAGINIGFYAWTSPGGYEGSHSSGLGLGGQIGGRYYFTNKVGINLEFGGGNAFSGGKIGVTISFNPVGPHL